ncbi:DUF300-domain-containing protein [Aureobasidium pullulans]|uniref:DUF300-domain-containing protein n=1 Tax=Aureobasidium pullulans TaxID=5580 RepID=A0A4S9AL21_AURPU|nr:DUF300-domain-containing protein [Aureobasidium pullulans]
MVSCNTTLEEQTIIEDPLFSKVTFHHVGLVVSAVFALISVVVAFFLVYKHATHYSKPWEQKHIIRILLMIPIYSTVSFLSYLYYKHSIYFEVLRDCYEAFAIASFFTLLCHYIAPNLHEQKDYFRQVTPINWFWSVFGLQKCTGGRDKGILRIPRSGLTWFNVVWFSVFQYALVRVLFTIVSVVTEAMDRYCENSLNPQFAHIWVMVFESASVTVAMFMLVQFYLQLKDDLAEHRPFLKVLCIKLVIFFSFWQSLVISFLSSSSGPLQPTKKISYPDIQVGIPSMLLCVEMAIFAVMHLFAFPWREYDLSKMPYTDPVTAPGSGFSGTAPKYHGGWMGVKAYGDTFNPWDLIKATARGFRWLFVRRKHRHHDISYTTPKIGVTVDEPATSIPGPNVTTHTLPSATELEHQRRARADTVDDADTAGLLSNAQHSGLSARPYPYSPSHSPIRNGSFDDRSDHGEAEAPGADMSLMGGARTQVPQPSAFGGSDAPRLGLNQWDNDTEYHSTTGPAHMGPYAGADGHAESSANQWDHWAGASRPH